jgi:hypothetical protein
MKRQRKNRAAVALAKRGNELMTPEQRSERARRAVQARWRKGKPNAYPRRWYMLVAFANDDPDHPEVLFWSRDKNEVRERARTPEHRDRATLIDFIDVDYDPRRFTVQPEFQPDADAQLKALHILLDTEHDEGGRL